MNTEPSFSLNNFKKWMSTQKEIFLKRETITNSSNLVGLHVESRLSAKKLQDRIFSEEGNIHAMAKNFKKNGGLVTNIDEDHNLFIKVDGGTFRIHKIFVKI
jgi:hypothetical protein